MRANTSKAGVAVPVRPEPRMTNLQHNAENRAGFTLKPQDVGRNCNKEPVVTNESARTTGSDCPTQIMCCSGQANRTPDAYVLCDTKRREGMVAYSKFQIKACMSETCDYVAMNHDDVRALRVLSSPGSMLQSIITLQSVSVLARLLQRVSNRCSPHAHPCVKWQAVNFSRLGLNQTKQGLSYCA